MPALFERADQRMAMALHAAHEWLGNGVTNMRDDRNFHNRWVAPAMRQRSLGPRSAPL